MLRRENAMSGIETRERALQGAVSLENLKRDNAEIAKGVRLSGSPAEAEAFAYIADRCRSFGMDVHEYAVDAYVSIPGEASLAVLSPEARDIECITHSFSVATGPEGITGALIAVGRGNADTDYAGKDVRGAIVLVDGLASPGAALAADRAGAVGMICVNPAGLHEMIISPVWGTPTPETAPYLPKVAAVSIRKEEGDALKALIASGPVIVRLRADVETGWWPIPALTADIPGTVEDRYVLFSGHVDSWHYGAMDNASADATMLEVGRIFSEHRSELRRGLRLAFWSGHSHARYGASAWYADTFFADLHDHCICHVNAESTGGQGASNVTTPGNMAETWQIAAGVVRDLLGEEMTYHRQGRSHDQSFVGMGVPSVLCGFSGPGEGGAAWWWHTPDDTLDKIDDANLVRDTQVYLLTCWRLCTAPVNPFDFTETAKELRERVQTLADAAGDRFDLSPLLAELDAFDRAAARLNAEAAAVSGDAERAERLNAAIMAAEHALIPVNYSKAGPFEVDLALGSPVLPGIAAIVDLGTMDPASDAARFLRTHLVRERNRVWHAIATARTAIEGALS
jgi:hypothetical protein